MPVFNKILFIDDDPITVNICERLMNHVQFANEFMSCNDGQTAKEFLQNNLHNLPDIIFVDLHMTVMSGWEFLAWFDEWSKTIEKNIPVYVLSSSLSKEDFQKTYVYNINGCIVKPITAKHLLDISAKHAV